MPVFYTHVDNGHGFQEDTEGSSFSNEIEARHRAVASGAEIIADELKGGRKSVKLTMHLHDSRGERLTSIPMSARIGDDT